jgi:hypothetical protein
MIIFKSQDLKRINRICKISIKFEKKVEREKCNIIYLKC